MMTQSGQRDENWMRQYMESLINPFSLLIKSPKILDSEVKYSAGIKLRATGEISCSTTTNTNIIIFPGLTNVLCYSTNPTGVDGEGTVLDNINVDGTIFRQHISTTGDRANVRLARLTGAAARFFLTNNSEEDDGYWEAARLTTHMISDAVLLTRGTSPPLTAAAIVKVLEQDYELANNPTYQFGHLRELHNYIFKLNSTDNDHKFSPLAGLDTTETPNLTNLADLNQWDIIFIKVRGRRTTPSVLRFDSVANQELVYAENSPLARMMDESPRDPNIDGFLEFSRVELPGFKATT